MRNLIKIVCLIMCLSFCVNSIHAKKKNNDNLIKVFISKDNVRGKGGFFHWLDPNWKDGDEVYKQLKKIKAPFIITEDPDRCDIILIPKVKNYSIKRLGRIQYKKERKYYIAFIHFEESFTVEIIVQDKDGNVIDVISNDFSGKDSHSGPGSKKRNIALKNAETAFHRAMADEIIPEFRNRIYDRLITNRNIKQYLFYLKSFIMLQKDNKKSFENSILWTGYFCTMEKKGIKNPFADIRENIQNKIDKYLQPRNLINIESQIPKMINKPILPELPKLVKGQFETKAMFDERVKKAMKERQLQILKLQERYRNDVEERNIKIENLTFEYNEDLEKIKKEQLHKKDKLQEKIIEFTKSAFYETMGLPTLADPVYDAETEIMYVNLKASNSDYQKKTSLTVPLSKAETFYNNVLAGNAKPIILYSIEEHSINLEEIKIYSNEGYYSASLTEEDFKPEIIEVTLEDKKINFNEEQQINLKLQNPNLIDTYQVSAIQYGESSKSRGLNYNDDLKPIVEQLEQQPEDSRNWLFIIAVENYDETDPVLFSKNSAELFKETAQKVFGIKERNTYALIEDDATSGKIKDKLQRLVDNVKEGDVIYFYYSGHGVPDPQSEESFILPKDKIVDYISKESEFDLSNIYKNLSDSKADEVFAFIDACFSGKTDNVPIFKGVAPGLIKTKKVKFNKDKMVVMTAGKDNQFSNSYDEKGHRMFSYYLIKSLTTRKKNDIDLLYKDISLKVHDTSFEKGDAYIQDPQIYGNKNLNPINKN